MRTHRIKPSRLWHESFKTRRYRTKMDSGFFISTQPRHKWQQRRPLPHVNSISSNRSKQNFKPLFYMSIDFFLGFVSFAQQLKSAVSSAASESARLTAVSPPMTFNAPSTSLSDDCKLRHSLHCSSIA